MTDRFMNMRELIDLCQCGDRLINEGMDYRAGEYTLIIDGEDTANSYSDDLKIEIRDRWLELYYKPPGSTEWIYGCKGDYDRINQFAYEL
jgi:hypothetical protein